MDIDILKLKDFIAKAIKQDIVTFGDFSDYKNSKGIKRAEDLMNIQFPSSYKWFLEHYAGGAILGDEIYSVYHDDENYNLSDISSGGDIIYQNKILDASMYINTPKNRIVFMKVPFDFGEIYFFMNQLYTQSESVYLLIGDGSNGYQLYANNFYDFLYKMIKSVM